MTNTRTGFDSSTGFVFDTYAQSPIPQPYKGAIYGKFRYNLRSFYNCCVIMKPSNWKLVSQLKIAKRLSYIVSSVYRCLYIWRFGGRGGYGMGMRYILDFVIDQ